LVDDAVEAAEEAFWSYGYSSADERAVYVLNTIADEIEARGSKITAIGTSETVR
jgi:NADP-dependent aldehyde dehydrogenase